jgi:hypothetical protein
MDIEQPNPSARPQAMWLALCICAVLICCQQKPTVDESAGEGETAELPADFLEFYRLFHSDSVYQMSHITFPLQGVSRDTAGRDSSVLWTENRWVLHHPIVPDEFWELDFTRPMENIVVEFIHAKQAGYWMERRFAKLGDTWYLIYYSDLKEPNSITNDE